MSQDNPWKDRLLTVLKVAISLGLIAYIFYQPTIRDADWGAILADFRPWPWLVALAIYFVAIGFKVLKWRYLLRTLDVDVPYLSLYRHNLVGLFFANLPWSMIGGDIARGWDLARQTEGKGSQVAVSVFVDRLVGMAAYLIAAVLGLAYAVVVMGRSDLTWLLTALALLLMVAAMGFAVLMSQRLRLLVERIFGLGPLRRFLSLYQKLSDSVQVYRNHKRALAVALGIGLAIVATTCVVNYVAARSAGVDIALQWVFVLTPLTAIAPLPTFYRLGPRLEPGGVHRPVLRVGGRGTRPGIRSGHVAGHAGHHHCSQPAWRRPLVAETPTPYYGAGHRQRRLSSRSAKPRVAGAGGHFGPAYRRYQTRPPNVPTRQLKSDLPHHCRACVQRG